MEKNCRSDVAAFPELFDGMEQFIDELATGIRRTSWRLALLLVPAGTLLLMLLQRTA